MIPMGWAHSIQCASSMLPLKHAAHVNWQSVTMSDAFLILDTFWQCVYPG